jgi:hypothetical protein
LPIKSSVRENLCNTILSPKIKYPTYAVRAAGI